MATREYETEDGIDEEFERIENLNFQYLSLKEEVEEKKKDLEYAEKELSIFIEDNKEYLL